MKDHRKAEIVNEITALAQRYAGTQQLREHMRGAILQYLAEQESNARNECAKIADDEVDKKFQYYYRNDACMAHSPRAADCICWFDEGTGPCAGERYDIKINKLEWRENPDPVPDIAKCNYCGSERDYQIIKMHTGLRQDMFVVECGNCLHDIIPVVVDHFMPEKDFYIKCKNAWNAVNATPEHKQDKSCG